MAPTSVPTPLPAYASTLFAVDPYPAAFWQQNLLHRGSMQPGSADEWRRFTARCRFTANLDTADYAYVHFDLAYIPTGSIESNWTDAQYNAANTALGGFLGSWAAFQAPGSAFDHTFWYRRAFNSYEAAGLPEYAHDGNPDTHWAPFSVAGPPVRDGVVSHAGGATSVGIPQGSSAVTLITESRRHWGRTYMPFLSGTSLGADGQFGNTGVDLIAAAADTLVTGLAAANIFVVVPTTQVQVSGQGKGQSTPGFGLLTVKHVQVDSVPDVVRRRRPHATRYRKAFPPLS